MSKRVENACKIYATTNNTASLRTRQEFAPPNLPLQIEALDGNHVASHYIPAGDVQKFVCMSRVLEDTILNFVDLPHRSVALITELHIGHLYLEMSSICRSSSDMQWNLHKGNVYRTVGNGKGNRQGHGRSENVWYGSFTVRYRSPAMIFKWQSLNSVYEVTA
jgi:hypothetical protein